MVLEQLNVYIKKKQPHLSLHNVDCILQKSHLKISHRPNQKLSKYTILRKKHRETLHYFLEQNTKSIIHEIKELIKKQI